MFNQYNSYRNQPLGCLGFFLHPETMTQRLIVVNAVVFFLTNILGASGMTPFFALYSGTGLSPLAGLLQNPGTFSNHPWGLVTHMFLHASLPHILFNMYGLWLFGRLVEPRLGATRFLVLYLISGLIGGALWLLCNWSSPAVLIGASGAVFGIMVAAALAYPDTVMMLLFPPVRMRLITMVMVYCAIELFLTLSQANSNVAHLAHLGGALGGLIYMNRLGFTFPANFMFWKNWFKTNDSKSYSSYSKESFTFDPKELNRILDKIANEGDASLTPSEREFLRKAADEMKRR